MKKIILISLITLAASTIVWSQNKSLGVGISTPNPNAALHVESPTNNQGLILPRLTTAQRTAMSVGATDKGLIVFDTDLGTWMVWSGTAWGIPFNGFTSNSNPAIWGTTTGTGPGVKGESTGAGQAGFFNINNAAHALPGLQSNTNGLGSAGSFFVNNASNSSDGIFAQHSGTGPAIRGLALGAAGAGYFEINNTGNFANSLFAKTNGNGVGIYGQNTGAGGAGYFEIINASNSTNAVVVNTTGTGNAVKAFASGTGGSAGWFQINNAANGASALNVTTNGTGAGGTFTITNASNSGNTLAAYSNGTGFSLYSENTGTGRAATFKVNNAASAKAALFSETTGTGPAGYFFNGSVIGPQMSGPAALIAETQSATGPAARFYLNGGSNGAAAVEAITVSSTGPAFYALSQFSNNIAIFQYGNATPVNVARIDKTGKGFFNGGTQSSGADVAEMFDVEGARESYEPGDVLVISESTDRTVEKSSQANSTRVVGVYATKPGVTLTEKGIEDNLDQLVPMGVIGVIPTKVCLENGAIRRGDLLVTSSTPGHAMKAISSKGDGMFPAGVVLGKALENFDGSGASVIKVLVNVK